MDRDLTRQALKPGSRYGSHEEAPRMEAADLKNEDDWQRRPPDWRWSLAQLCAEQEYVPSRADDRYTHEAARYCIRYNRFSSLRNSASATAQQIKEARRELVTKHPKVSRAHYIFNNSDDERWLLEALICARVPANVIAASMCATTELVTMYEALFFEVRSRLSCKTFIVSHILHPRQLRGSYGGDADLVWKDIGYWQGMDALLDIIGGATFAQEKVQDYIKAIQSNTMRDSILIGRGRALNQHSAETIMMDANALQSHQLAAGAAGQIGGKMAQGTEILMDAVKFTRIGVSATATALEQRPTAALLKRLEDRGFNAKKLPERVE